MTTERQWPEITHEVEIIDEERAEKYLALNKHNRNMKEGQVVRLSDTILDGDWRLNGETIIFDDKGRLADGQNRLQALVLACQRARELGQPLPTIAVLVVRGVEPEAQDTMDDVVKRSAADALKLAEFEDPNHLAATLNLINCWSHGDRGLRNKTRHRLTPVRAVRMARQYEHVGAVVKEAHRIRSRMNGVVPLSMLAACWWKFSTIDDDSADDCRDFFSKLADGKGLFDGDPIYALRRILWSNHSKTTKSPPLVVHAWIVKAWNYYRSGVEVEHIVWKPNTEIFPEPI